MNTATRPTGHFARLLGLLRTPVHLPGWGARRKTRRPLPVVIGSSAPLERVLVPVPELLSPMPPSPAAIAPKAAAAAAAAAATAATATTPAQAARLTRSLAEVRADLARMREQARARAEQAQAHAQALAQLREAERAQREDSFAPTDFMDFDGCSAPQPQPAPRADKPLLDDHDLFSSSFAATDFQGIEVVEHGARPAGERDGDFDATAFAPPSLPGRSGTR